MKSILTAAFTLIVFLAGAALAGNKTGPLQGLKIIAVWSVDGTSAAQVQSAVDQARSLGFNAVCWNNQFVSEACHKRSMKAFSIVSPLDRRPGARLQEMLPEERGLPGCEPDKIAPSQFYQYGGEPVPGNREVLDQNFTCPNDTGVVNYTLKRIAADREAGYDGVILDFMGYRNYHSCECEICRAKLEAFRKKHPEMSGKQAGNMYFEQVLVELYDTLYRAAKARYPEIILATHIHPVFTPAIMYGLRVNIDLCAITVSWFFKPHWSLDKVRTYTERVVKGPYKYEHTEGMPMIGFYSDGAYARDRKSSARLREEFEILKQMNARHLLVCELGHILRDNDAAAAVKAELLDSR